MFALRKWLIFLLTFGTWVGCSDVGFESVPSYTCQSFNARHGDGSCAIDPSGYNRYSYSVRAGEVDILFVDDNSGSMSVEQQKMGEKFPTFLNSINNLDYQIAIITTDVSGPKNPPDAANGNGAFQDGKFLKYPNGDYILTRDTSNKLNQFYDTIRRPETLACDSNQPCPSGDERGIYAVNLAFNRADSRFFRKDSHLAIVILSDEDERSVGGDTSVDPAVAKAYPLEPMDLPKTMVQKLGEQFGEVKSMSVHAVIIPPNGTHPDSQNCFTKQNNQLGVKGFYGKTYAQLAKPNSDLKAAGNIVDGVIGSICANDYGAQLGDIGSKITENVGKIQLACTPVVDSVEVTFDPAPRTQVTFDVDDKNRLVLTPPAPAGTNVNVTYLCPRSA